MAEDRCISLDDIRSSNEIKENKPRIKDLQNLVTPNYASCWKEIGIQLDIPVGVLDSIEVAYPTNPVWCCNNMWIHWCKFDTEASWNKVIKAIDSPAIATMVKSFNSFTLSTPLMVNKRLEAVLDLACRLKTMSIKNRYKIEDDNWHLISPKHFTSVALIHHKGEQSKREVLAIATLQNRGNFDLNRIHTDDEYFKQSKCTKDISDIFTEAKYADGTTKYPGIILIEGVPGIGKTVLSKELLFQWAKGRLLSTHTLVFLIHLRDTESHKINSLESFVNYVSYPEVAEHILKYIADSKGKNITVVFDGYDELSEEFRNNSYLYKMMTQRIIEIPLCSIVITSRPNASAHLHDMVDCRVEILGFTNEDRKAYITEALNDESYKVEVLIRYLNNNPAIDAYCYIPLNMTILLSLFRSSDVTDINKLPNTQTEINEKFICTTISRYIRKSKRTELTFSSFSDIQAPCDDHEIGTPCIGHEKGVPYGRIFKEISKLAFKALENDKIVFTSAELQEACPCLEAHSKNWDGLGLLKAVQFFSFDDNLRNVSFNFLHFTVQEILAAYHITLMSAKDQIKCMKETFWNNRYYNMWILYVGLEKSELPISYKHFLSGNWLLLSTRFHNWWNSGAYYHITGEIINDKVKCLYLFQCFSEAENKDLCQYVGRLLQDNEIDLSQQTLSAINLYTLSLFLARSTTKHWGSLNLSRCFIGNEGVEQLYKSFTSNNRTKVCIDNLNLSQNNLANISIDFIARLILEWSVKKLDICFNAVNISSLIEEVMYWVMEQPMHLVHNNILITYDSSVTFFVKLSKSEYLNVTFKKRNAQDCSHLDHQETVDVKTIIQILLQYTTISYLDLNTIQCEINDIVTIIKNNKFIKYLYLSKMQNIKLKMIFDALKTNVLLRYMDMSLITIDSDVVKDVAVVMENNIMLKEMQVSKLLLRHGDFEHLKSYIIKFKGLKHLSITGCTFYNQDLDKIKSVVMNNYTLEFLNLSHCTMSNEMINELGIIFSRIVSLKYLYICNDQLLSNEIGQIFKNLKALKLLECVDLTGNYVTNYTISDIEAMIISNKQLQTLCLPSCMLNHTSLRILFQAICTVSSLQYVDLSTSKIDNDQASDVAILFANNSQLKQLNFTKLILKHSGFHYLKTHIVKFKGLKHLSITDCTFSNQDAVYLESVIGSNHKLRNIIISNCKMSTNNVFTMVDTINMYGQLERLELRNNSSVSPYIHNLLVFLSCSCKLMEIIFCDCQLKYNEIKQLVMVLKYMRHLECVDLSGNAMTDDLVSVMEAMIINNKQLQKLCLPNCFLNQTSLGVIIQAMLTVASLRYDLSTNQVENKLANDVATLFVNNNELKQIKISELVLSKTGFQHLGSHLFKIKGLKLFNITGCSFTAQDAAYLVCLFKNQELMLSNCKIDTNQLLSILLCNIDLRWLDLSNCQLQSNVIKQIFSVLKQMEYLQYVDLRGNIMLSDTISETAQMIKRNKHLQAIYLPDCILKHQKYLGIIIQAMHTISSLQYVDLSTNIIDNDLAVDVAVLFANNANLKQLKFFKLKLDQIGFEYIKTCLMKFHEIKHFSITNCNFTDEDAANIAIALRNNTKIQELDLSNCTIFYKMDIFKHLTATSLLRCLKLNNIIISDKMEDKVITIIKNNSNLEHLELAGCNISKTLYVKLIKCTQIKNVSKLNFSDNSIVSKEIHDLLLPMLSCHPKLKLLNLSNCQLQFNETKELLMILKQKRHLECVDLSGNAMTDDSVCYMEAMIVNNKQLQKLCIPNCVLNQTSVGIIIQAIQAVSSLRYVNLSTNKVENKLANDVATLLANNNKIKISELVLSKTGFQHLGKHIFKIKGLKLLSITGCSFTAQDAAYLVCLFEIQELKLSNCRINTDQLLSILLCNIDLKWLDLSNCQLQSNDIKQIFSVLKQMEYLQHVDLSGNIMLSDTINEAADMIKRNKHLQAIYLPDCILKHQKYLRIIIQAMHTISSLQYVDLSRSVIDNDLAGDVSILFVNNANLKQLKIFELKLDQIGFEYIKTFLMKFHEIKHFSITNCNFTDQDAANIAIAFSNSTKIQELDLSNCTIFYKMDIFKHLTATSLLRCLKLNNIIISDKIEDKVISIIKNNGKLEHLEMAGCNMSKTLYVKLIKCTQIKNILKLNFSSNSIVSKGIHDLLLPMLSSHCKLKLLDLSNCQLQSNETKQLLMVLKYMRHLDCVDLSGNAMTDDSVSDMEAMIVNNKQLQKLCLPNSVLTQANLRIIIQAMQTTKKLRYVDFSTNKVDDELASDVADLIMNNSKLEQIFFEKFTLSQSSFQHLKKYLVKFNGLKLFSITGCIFASEEVTAAVASNSEIEELKTDINKQMFSVLKQMEYLQHIDVSANFLRSDAINEIAEMIKSNKQIKSLSLPSLSFIQEEFRIIFQALKTVSSLQHVNFNTAIKIHNELASNVAAVFANNNKLEKLNVYEVKLMQSGFQDLKMHFLKLKGLKHLHISDCTFSNQDAFYLGSVIGSNHKLRKVVISNCKMITHNIFTVMDTINIYDQLEHVELRSNSCISPFIHNLLVFLSCSYKLERIILYDCKLQSHEIKQIVMVLKYMKHLEHVDLSGNAMTDDSVSDMEAMIVNNKQLQKLCLPNCVLHQTSLGVIIQAMQTVSSLRYANLSTNKVQNKLANDVATLFANNNELKQINISELVLNKTGFQHLGKHIFKIKGLKLLSITECPFTAQDAAYLVCLSEIQELKLSNCRTNAEQLLSILLRNIDLRWLNLSNCQLQSNDIKQIFSVLKQMEYLQHVDLSGNIMLSDTISEAAQMIKRNKHLQAIYLPDCILKHQKYLRIIIQAMHTISSLQYVDLSTNIIDNDLAGDVAILFANNANLKQLKFFELKLDQIGFEYIKTCVMKFHEIKNFSITNCIFTDQDAANIVIALCNNTKIQELDLSNCTVFYKIDIFKHLTAISLLRCLKLNNITISDKMEDEVITIIKNNGNLEHLEMAECNMSKTLYVKLIKCIQIKNISKLNLSGNSIVSKEIHDLLLPMLSCHSKLKLLDLSNCQLRSNDTKEILMVLKQKRHLECVYLSGNAMTDDSVCYMEAMIVNNKQLQRLYISNCICYGRIS